MQSSSQSSRGKEKAPRKSHKKRGDGGAQTGGMERSVSVWIASSSRWAGTWRCTAARGRSCFRPTTPARPWKSWRAEAAFLQLCLSARTNDLLLPVQNAGQPCNIKQNAVVFLLVKQSDFVYDRYCLTGVSKVSRPRILDRASALL